MAKTALRARMLFELDNAANGLSQVEILNIYNSKSIINTRIQRMIKCWAG